MFLKVVFFVSFHYWKNFSLGNFSLGFVHKVEKNDVQLTFDDSYICYVSKIDVFKVVLC